MTNPLEHIKTFSINWGDMDALGHVNNARYFDYFQEARIEWMSGIQLDMKQKQGPVLIHTACTFHKPVVYPAVLTLKSNLHSLGNTSLIMEHHLFQHDTLMAKGESKIVWVDFVSGKPVRVPEVIRVLFHDQS